MSDRLRVATVPAGRRGPAAYPVHVLAMDGYGWHQHTIYYRECPRWVYCWCVKGYSKRIVGNWFYPPDAWNRLQHHERYSMALKYIKAALAASSAGGKGSVPVDAELAKSCPAVAEFMTATTGPDGKARQTSTLTVFTDQDGWKVCLNERDADLSLWAVGTSLLGALAALEERLVAPVVEWRRRSPAKPPRPAKGK